MEPMLLTKFGNCLDVPCANCEKKWGDHEQDEAKKCSDILFLHYKALEVLSLKVQDLKK